MKKTIIKEDRINSLIKEKAIICISPEDEYLEELMKQKNSKKHVINIVSIDTDNIYKGEKND